MPACSLAVRAIVSMYKEFYPELSEHLTKIITLVNNEAEKFKKAIMGGMREFEKYRNEFFKV